MFSTTSVAKQDRHVAPLCVAAARIATGMFGWTPEVFWRSTPQDFRLALEGRLGRTGGEAGALGRGELEQLMARFPDDA